MFVCLFHACYKFDSITFPRPPTTHKERPRSKLAAGSIPGQHASHGLPLQIELEEPASFIDRVTLPYSDSPEKEGGAAEGVTNGREGAGAKGIGEASFQQRLAACEQNQEAAYAQWFDANQKIQEEVQGLLALAARRRAQGLGDPASAVDYEELLAAEQLRLEERRDLIAQLATKDSQLRLLRAHIASRREATTEDEEDAGEEEELLNEDFKDSRRETKEVPTYNWCYCWEMPDLDEYVKKDYAPADTNSEEHMWWQRARWIELDQHVNLVVGTLVLANTIFIGFEVWSPHPRSDASRNLEATKDPSPTWTLL